MEYYSDIKKNEIMPFAATWMDLEIIILREVSKSGGRGGLDWEFETSRCKVLYIRWIKKKVLLCRTGD